MAKTQCAFTCMKISIITINKNNADGLYKTIQSVVEQTYKEIEYIIIDGASSDGSKDIINSFKYVVDYWISEPDKGVYNAMNKGIVKSTGDYCLFLNSGDYLYNKDVIYKICSSEISCSIIYGNMVKTLLNGKYIVDKNAAGNPLSFFNFYQGTINHSCTLIKRNLFEKYGLYDDSLKIVSDWKFFLIAIAINNETVQYVDLTISVFNMLGISNTDKELKKEERQVVLKQFVPNYILVDYQQNWPAISKMRRINRYRWARFIVFLIERLLFKYEKVLYRPKKKWYPK